MRRLNWSGLVRRINDRRAPAAQFFKPTCLIAAIDLADEGLFENNLNADYIIKRFSDYVTPFHGSRGRQGYKPLWHLSNDGIWSFFKDEKVLDLHHGSKDSPASITGFYSKFDRLSISEEYVDLWKIPKERRALRDSMLLMLAEGDASCQRLVAPLFNPRYLLNADWHPSSAALSAYFKTVRDQLYMFEDANNQGRPPESNGALLPDDRAGNTQGRSLSAMPALEPVEGIPSAVEYAWHDSRMLANIRPDKIPSISRGLNKRTFDQCLEACIVDAKSILDDIRKRKWQISQDFAIEISRYLDRLPKSESDGNIILADGTARVLREMFKAESNVLPSSFAARLKVVLQQHYAIRTFYPEIENFYQAVNSGRIVSPLPLDAVSEIIGIVNNQSPGLFDKSVSEALNEVSSEVHGTVDESGRREINEISDVKSDAILPPADPLGEADLEKAFDVQKAGAINRFWKVFRSGEEIKISSEAWLSTYQLLSPYIVQVIGWLQNLR